MSRTRCAGVALAAIAGLASAASAQPSTTSEEADATDPPAPAASEPAPSPEDDESDLGFGFGSYGRIGVATDMRGGTPEQAEVVAHGSRIAEPSYLELDLYYRGVGAGGVEWRTVTTLAFDDTLFHYTGEFDATPALRNLYAEAETGAPGYGRAGIWIGSRMYRGDDIFLLDYWPLDDLNTIGGGAWYRRDRLGVAVHAGANRLLTPFQFQEREVSDPEFGSRTIVQLDRQRFVASAKGDYRVWGPAAGPAVEVKLYTELQALPEGTRLRDDNTPEELPQDYGLVLGGQVGTWGFAPGMSHANLFARLSVGLAAFDELAPPVDFDDTKKTFPDASELLVGWSGNYEFSRGGVLVGGYTRRFVDADDIEADRDDGWEYIFDVRPHVALWREVGAALDLSYQARFPRGLSAASGVALDPAVWQIAPMLLYSPMGWSSYDRPQFRLIYRAAHLNEGARDLFALDDPRRNHEWTHYLGVQAEWWFNSTYR